MLGHPCAGGAAGPGPGESLPDPKDKRQILEQYREAVDLAAARRWPQAIAVLEEILRGDPEMADLAERRRDMARVVESVTITARATRAERGRWSPLPERVAVAWRGDPGEEALEAAAA